MCPALLPSTLVEGFFCSGPRQTVTVRLQGLKRIFHASTGFIPARRRLDAPSARMGVHPASSFGMPVCIGIGPA